MSYELTNTSLKIEVEDKTYTLRRIKRVNLAKFKEKYDLILQKFLECNAAVGNFLIDEQNVNLLIDVCKLIPIDEEDGFLKFEYIEDDYVLIAKLFLSESLNEETLIFEGVEESGFKQSAISRFQLWNFAEAWGKAQLAAIETMREKEEMENKTKESQKKTKKNSETKMEALII